MFIFQFETSRFSIRRLKSFQTNVLRLHKYNLNSQNRESLKISRSCLVENTKLQKEMIMTLFQAGLELHCFSAK